MVEFFNILNNAHNSISFKMEKENNNELAFLDVQIKRDESGFLTSVYRKKHFTGCYLNSQSNYSLKRKVNLIRTLCHRGNDFFPRLALSEIKEIKLLLNKNGYPLESVKNNLFDIRGLKNV